MLRCLQQIEVLTSVVSISNDSLQATILEGLPILQIQRQRQDCRRWLEAAVAMLSSETFISPYSHLHCCSLSHQKGVVMATAAAVWAASCISALYFSHLSCLPLACPSCGWPSRGRWQWKWGVGGTAMNGSSRGPVASSLSRATVVEQGSWPCVYHIAEHKFHSHNQMKASTRWLHIFNLLCE